MCGLIAIFNFNNLRVDNNIMEKMLLDIQHRGPDSKGLINEGFYSLGFRRLSIIDLSDSANQPFQDPSGKYQLIFNGEIYNYKILRKILKSKGFSFFTESDTEVLLNSLIFWGEKALNKIEGMFSLIFINKISREIIVARDPLGIKPLYYYEMKDRIIFSSEIKPFKHIKPLELNESKIYEYFKYKYIGGEHTLYRKIKKVKKGNLMKISFDGKIKKKQFYSINNEKFHNFDIKDLYHELEHSIISHTHSDVGYNLQLSGGLDSSIIAAVLKDNTKLNSYGISLKDNERFDELIFQKAISKKFNTNHLPIFSNAIDYPDLLMKATFYFEQPIVHSGCPLIYLLTKYSKKTSPVCISGEGADELFCGYSRYNIKLNQSLAFLFRKIKFNTNLFSMIPYVRGIVNLIKNDIVLSKFNNGLETFKWLVPELKKEEDYRFEKTQKFDKLIDKIHYVDQNFYLESLLDRQDKLSMANSVETRVPYCNIKLFKIMNSIDNFLKVKGQTKIHLKKFGENFFDNDFIYRKKNGFRIPLKEWLKNKKSIGKYLDLLTDKNFKERGFFKNDIVEIMIKEHISDKKDWYKELFTLINFELWFRIYILKSL